MSDRGYFKAWLEKLVGNYSLLTVSRSFIEIYAIFMDMFSYLSNIEKFKEFIRKLLAVDMRQELKCFELLRDSNHIADNLVSLNEYLTGWYSEIKDFFPDYYNDIIQTDEKDREEFLINTVKKIAKNTKNGNATNEMEVKKDLIYRALSSNLFLTELNNKGKICDPEFIYPKLCESAHSNCSNVFNRTINNGCFVYDKGNEIEAFITISVVKCCIRDIISRVSSFFAEQ